MVSESDSRLADAVLEELGRYIARYGVRTAYPSSTQAIMPAPIPESLGHLLDAPLPRAPMAVVVDVYGTILASASGECSAQDSAASGASAGFPPDMAERLGAIIRHDHERQREQGMAWPEVDAPLVFARALAMPQDDLAYTQGARACVAWECAMNPCAAMPGAADALGALRARGLSLGIVSNAQFYSPLFMEAAFGAPLYGKGGLGFDPELVLWSYRTKRAKPDRWMFDELASRLRRRGVPAGRALYVGNDALSDCAAAGEAGFMTALFAGDARSCKPRVGHQRVQAMPPSTIVASWDALRRMVCT